MYKKRWRTSKVVNRWLNVRLFVFLFLNILKVNTQLKGKIIMYCDVYCKCRSEHVSIKPQKMACGMQAKENYTVAWL